VTDALRIIPVDILKSLDKKDLITLLEGEQDIRQKMQTEIELLKSANENLKDQVIEVNGKYVRLKSKIFERSSEKSRDPVTKKDPKRKKSTSPKARKRTQKSLSEKYPNTPIVEQNISLTEEPNCPCCQDQMSDSGLTEVTEYLEVTPKKYSIIRQQRVKYRCQKCYGSLVTAPNPPRVKAGSAYSDAFILDVALSKYCDLIPIERYATIAKRLGIDLPQNSLIGLTHHLAGFVKSVYDLLRKEVLSLRAVHADETRHKMLEGDENPNWYLWGFSNKFSCYFEYHDTRAGKVASTILLESFCQVLVSDVFSGYLKAVNDVNKNRIEKKIKNLIAAFCNSHSRRKFKEVESKFEDEAGFYIEQYKKIYAIEKVCKNISPNRRKKFRRKMLAIFTKMRLKAKAEIERYSSNSGMYIALNYFLNNFEGLTVFIKNPHVAIDNNSQERLLRSPVIGRKTWLGTHSRKGAETAAILFSIVESCKLNFIDPRKYFKDLVNDLHNGSPPYTPRQYKLAKQKSCYLAVFGT